MGQHRNDERKGEDNRTKVKKEILNFHYEREKIGGLKFDS